MVLATFPLQTIYNLSPTIFDGMTMPEGVDKDIVVGEIISQLGELDVIYQNPEQLAAAIRTWSYSMNYKWTKIYATTTVYYDPLINRDYNREETVTGQSTVNAGSKVAGYNEGELVKNGESDSTGSSTQKNILREWGNVSLKTTPMILQEERDYVDFSFVQMVIDDFKHRFCVAVW